MKATALRQRRVPEPDGSSLLNALTNRNALARTSNTPGRTQELNFFDVGDPLKFRLVDMPGYGYASAPKAKVASWTKLIHQFLLGRATLARVYVLIDARHGTLTLQTVLRRCPDGAGAARVLNDRARIRDLWTPAAKAWWEGPDDPRIRVFRSRKNRGDARARNAIGHVAGRREHGDPRRNDLGHRGLDARLIGIIQHEAFQPLTPQPRAIAFLDQVSKLVAQEDLADKLGGQRRSAAHTMVAEWLKRLSLVKSLLVP